MNEKAEMRRRILEYDFAIHELVLFLDTHPNSARAMELLRRYRRRRAAAQTEYEEKYGPLVVSPKDVNPSGRWSWVDGPWPWENNFLEG